MTVPSIPDLVLVVDDVEGNRLLAQAHLKRIGWQVRMFADAASVLEFLDHTRPRAMLIDVRMPGLRGDTLASLLKAQPETQSIRLVGYTAHALPDELVSLRASGFDEVLIKPVLYADMQGALPLPA